MFALISSVLLVLVGIGLLVFLPGRQKLVGLLGFLLAFVVLGVACTTVVQAKTIGIVTAFGKVDRPLEPGLSFKRPWEQVTDIDGTVKTMKYDGDNCLWVRIGDGSRSCVSLTIRYQAVPEQATTIYTDYRATDPIAEVGSNLVSPELKAALQKTLGDYNPVSGLKVVKAADTGKQPVSFAPDYDEMSTKLLADMRSRTDLVDFLTVSVTYVSISDNTQNALDDFIKAVGATVVAQQNKETSSAQAAANRELAASVQDPGVNVARCLDAVNRAIEKGYQFNAGFTCLGGTGAVVVPSQ